MYYDFYCNEKMLLDHYEDYNVGNRTLRRLLGQSGMPPDVCADTYLAKMDNHEELEYDRYDLIKSFEQLSKERCELLHIDKIKIYEQDVEYIKDAVRKYPLTQKETLVLFGVILMCRIKQVETLDLTTKYKLQQFCGCFEGFKRKIWKVCVDTGKWYETYHEPNGIKKLCDTYDLLLRTKSEPGPDKIGCYYTYYNYELKNKNVIYEYVVTPRTNRLDIWDVFCNVGLQDIHFCKKCGTEYHLNSSTTLYCKKCAKEIKKEQTRERVKRYRNRNK